MKTVQVPATYLDWQTIPNFTPSEFPEGVLERLDGRVVEALQDIRTTSEVLLYPSPLYGAHVRDDSSGSRHNTRGGRLSDATDFFVLKSQAHKVYQAVMNHPAINGAGFYQGSIFRGNPDLWCLCHIDIRPRNEAVFWTARRKETEGYSYTYLHNSPRDYFKILEEICQ